MSRREAEERFEVVVVGASMAGLHVASRLAAAGRKVAVFERQRDLYPARRTLIVTSEVRRVLPGLPAAAVLHSTGTMLLSSPEADTRLRFQTPDLVVERAAVSRWLLERARQAGARIFLGHRFDGFPGQGREARLRFQDSDRRIRMVRAGTVIGADGVNSSVVRAAELPVPPSVPVLQAEVSLPPAWDPDLTRVWFDPSLTRFFYWLIPESRDRGVAGLVGHGGAQARLLLGSFLARQGLRAHGYQAARVALHHPGFKPWGRIGDVRVLLVGDAAAQVKVTTVGGTVTGIQGASAAARAIRRGTSYRRELRSLKRELDLHWWIRRMLERLDRRGYDLLVQAVSEPLKGFLAHHNRDSMAPVFWRLPLVEPRLWRVALRCLRREREPWQGGRGIERPVTEVES